MFKNRPWLTILLLAVAFPICALNEDKIHILKELIVIVDGNTKISAIKAYIQLKEGEIFATEEELITKASRALQDLVNYRVFKKSSMNAERISDNAEQTEWRVTLYVQDGWTLLPIPYPKFDSNTGFRLGLKTFYDNAFGTMSNIFLGLGMNIGPRHDGNWGVGEWSINPKWSGIRMGPLKFYVDYLQAYEENKFDTTDKSRAYDYGYSRSKIAVGSSVPFFNTGLGYSFSVNFNMKYNYINYLDTQNYTEEPFSMGWDHGLSLGRVDWKENFRHGQNIGLGHGISFIINPDTNKYYPVNSLTLGGGFFRILGRRFNFYSRAGTFIAFDNPISSMGGDLRGVANDEMSGNWGLYLNNSLGFQFWRLHGVWDAQVHPFFDIGISSPFDGADINRDLQYSAGLDFVLYLDALPNLVARGMIGVNLGKYDWNDRNKYEITITSTLHY